MVEIGRRIEEIEAKRVLKNRSERSSLARESQPIQDAIDAVLFRYYGLSEFEDAVGRIPDLRNQIMHPVRPLMTDAESLVKLKEDIGISILLAQGLKELRSRV